jgi:hypothetical protein
MTAWANNFSRTAAFARVRDRLSATAAGQQPQKLFPLFLPADITRGHGEALSIKEMVEHAIATFDADRRKVFVTGLSAGGAMAAYARNIPGGFCRRRDHCRTAL